MTRRPVHDERLVVPARSVLDKDRVYVRELAQYLGHSLLAIRKFARKYGYLKKASRGASRTPITYVSPYAAMRIIAHIRRIQGEVYERGKDFHEIRERERASHQRLKARSRLALANPGAEAEAERQRSACAKAESPKPRRCV